MLLFSGVKLLVIHALLVILSVSLSVCLFGCLCLNGWTFLDIVFRFNNEQINRTICMCVCTFMVYVHGEKWTCKRASVCVCVCVCVCVFQGWLWVICVCSLVSSSSPCPWGLWRVWLSVLSCPWRILDKIAQSKDHSQNTHTERERERDRERKTQAHIQRERERESEREKDTGTHTERERKRQAHIQRRREREREAGR